MNMTEARKLAVVKWGVRGKVAIDRYHKTLPDGTKRKMVGVHGRYDWDIFTVLGSGWTWEEAFEKAEKHIKDLETKGYPYNVY